MPTHANKTILVTGATGHQGGAAFHHLRGKFPLRVLARDFDDPKVRSLTGSGVELVRGDLEDLASLKRAMDGAHGVYSMQTSNDTEAEVRQGINVVEAAVSQSIAHIVYSSVTGADQHTGSRILKARAHRAAYIHASGIKYTILRPVFFMENWLNWKDQILNGRLELPLRPETRMQMEAVDDIGALRQASFRSSGKMARPHLRDRGRRAIDESDRPSLQPDFGARSEVRSAFLG